MDILTYVLARNGAEGALAGLFNISINDDRKLVFEFSDRDPIVTSTAIPAAGEADIVASLINNEEAVLEALDIPKNAVGGVLVELGTDINGDPIYQEYSIEDHVLKLPLASGTIPGLVKGVDVSESEENKENKISINEDGTMSVYSLNVNKLVQSEDDELIIGDIGA